MPRGDLPGPLNTGLLQQQISDLKRKKQDIAQKNVPNGYVGLGPDGYVNPNTTSPYLLSMEKNYQENTPEITNLPNGAITDSITTSTKVGALSTATIAKVGNFDNYIITDGTNTSVIHFPQLKVCDTRAILRARIKVDAYHTNAALDSLIGIGLYGQQSTSDTGNVYEFVVYFNLTNKTVTWFNNNSSFYVDVSAFGFQQSGGALVASGDIVELVVQRLPEIDGFFASITNTYTGEFVSGVYKTATNSRSLSIQNAHLSMRASNGTYTVLDHRASFSTPASPLLYMMGDSYTCGDNNIASATLQSLMIKELPYYIVSGAGNGAAFNSMAKFQVPEIVKLKPKYVLVNSALAVFYGYFDDGNANQTQFELSFNAIMKAVISVGAVPILVKWQSGGAGVLNNNGTAWNTYIDNTLLVAYPTSIILDLRNEALALSLALHPTAEDMQKIKIKLVQLLKNVGAIPA